MSDTQELARAVDEIAAQYYIRSWGYDQTNVDFYKVVGRTPKGVRVQHWQSVSVDRGQGATYVLPGDGPATRYVHRFDPGAPELEACGRCRTYTDGWMYPGSIAYACPDCAAHCAVETPEPVTFHRLRPGSDWIRVEGWDLAKVWDGSAHYETAAGWGH